MLPNSSSRTSMTTSGIQVQNGTARSYRRVGLGASSPAAYSSADERGTAAGPRGPRDRVGARGLVRRHARAAGHPAPVRRRDPAGRLGADGVQPRPRARGGPRRLRGAPAPTRCVQALGGALLVCAALDLLTAIDGSDARAVRTWATAGVVGAALGPAAGGILTETLGWESIFLVQAPLALVTLVGVVRLRVRPLVEPAGRPNVPANLALLLLSG